MVGGPGSQQSGMRYTPITALRWCRPDGPTAVQSAVACTLHILECDPLSGKLEQKPKQHSLNSTLIKSLPAGRHASSGHVTTLVLLEQRDRMRCHCSHECLLSGAAPVVRAVPVPTSGALDRADQEASTPHQTMWCMLLTVKQGNALTRADTSGHQGQPHLSTHAEVRVAIHLFRLRQSLCLVFWLPLDALGSPSCDWGSASRLGQLALVLQQRRQHGLGGDILNAKCKSAEWEE